jgi:alpha-L-rhamnosidase
MRIYDVRVNGVAAPVGFLIETVRISWKIADSISKNMKEARIRITDEMGKILCERTGKLDSIGENFDMELSARTKYTVWISVEGNLGDSASAQTEFVTGKHGEEWTAKWIGKQLNDERFPVFSKKFRTKAGLRKSFLHICGLGLFEAYLDGKKIGDEYLTPLLSEYHSEQQVMTYLLTDRLEEGEHELSVYLGEGWYMGRFGGTDGARIWGSEMALIAEIHQEYQDGTVDLTVTDESWLYKGSDIVMANIYDGEDLNRLAWKDKENPALQARLLEWNTNTLVDRVSLPVKAKETLSAVQVIHTPAGETVLDFGQNHAGMVQFYSRQPKGAVIILDHGEVLQDGNFYNGNYRSARARLVYTSVGREEMVRSHFTYYGFRYVRVTGWQGELDPSDFSSLVLYSDIAMSGNFRCSEEKINRLYQNSCWGQKSNFIDMPTDCPQRDERLGWTGDAEVFVHTANLHSNAKVFYDKFLRDLRYYQIKENGGVPSSIPPIGVMSLTAAVWGDAATIIPMNLYDVYGDKEMLKRHYPMMRDWVEYVHREDCKGREPHYLYDFGFQWGDWLALDGPNPQSNKGGTEDTFIASMYYCHSLELTAEAAAVIGLKEDAETYRLRTGKVREAILNEYFSPSGRLCIDTQTAYILALHFGIYREKEKILQSLENRLAKDDHKVKCGFVGAPLICEVLGQNGLEQEAYKLLLNEEYPGWLYAVNLGATTIWERWNSLLPDGKINGTDMNSLNHYSYGSVASFLYEGVAGIRRNDIAYRSVIFEPKIDIHLKYVEASYDSVSGKYAVSWRLTEDNKVSVQVEVPFGCHAILRLPHYNGGEIALDAGNYEYSYAPDPPYIGKTLETMSVDELIGHPACADYIREYAYPLMALAESNGEETKNMPALAALDVAVSMCGLNPDVAVAIKERVS